MILYLLLQCILFIDNSLDLISLCGVGLYSDEPIARMAKQIVPARLLIMPLPERFFSV